MTKIAKFSNGFEDEYKGRRDVKAAWMITDRDGKVIDSGHSLDRQRAYKTARSNWSMRKVQVPGGLNLKFGRGYFIDKAKKEGFAGLREYINHLKEINAKHAATLTIEIVDL